MFYEYADTRPCARAEDPSIQLFFQLTATLAAAGLFYEAFIGVSIFLMGLNRTFQTNNTTRRRLRLNRKMLYVFAFLATIYTLMALDIQVVHEGWIAEVHGGQQIVYSLRYIEWVMCAPMVLSISGQLDHAPDGSPRNGMVPSSLLTGIYCAIAWQGLVVKDFYAAWASITWAFVSYFVASAEQMAFAWHIKDKGSSGKLRCGLIVYIVIMMGFYGVVYLLPIPGWISTTFENKFYCVGDISFKLATSIMLIASNDLAANHDMITHAKTLADDLEILIHTAAVPIIGTNDAGLINEWNRTAAKLTGLPEDLAMGKKLIDMFGTASRAEAAKVIRQAMLGHEGGSVETTLNPGQLEGWCSAELSLKKATLVLSATPRRDKKGLIKGVTLVGYDLTEVTAYKEAEARKINFMAIVSHELRSPLHGIIGLMEHLSEEEEDPSKLRFMKMASNCGNRLIDLVVNIMDMASMVSVGSRDKTAPVKNLLPDPVDLNKIMDEILILVKSSTDKAGKSLLKKGVDLVSEVNDLPVIEADAHKCTQVFFNIITNACKFTEKGKIIVTSRVDPDYGNWVEVSVSDTGKGISQVSLERIFQPFEQEDNSMIRGYQGIGLGLSIAHEVVRRHGGFIAVESEVGVGSTFTVRLPKMMKDCTEAVVTEPEDIQFPMDEVEKPSQLSEDPVGNAPTPRPLLKPKILSVDDDATNQELIKRTLGSRYDVDVAMDGYEALNYLKSCNRAPDVMLLDVMMPGLSGFDVCRAVRQEMHIPPVRLPILMLSASAEAESIAAGLDSGANDYITKPFHKQILTAHVEAALRLSHWHKQELDQAAGRPMRRVRMFRSEADSENGVRRRVVPNHCD
jgi:signal transduction histidine kinase/CheY-like chemotaxis protein/bacteriorhodopsin